MGKKNLEQLFKDIFLDFKEVPDDKVWSAIENSLDKKRQRNRILPLWWQIGGIAAALAILFFVFNPFEEDKGIDKIITGTENTAEPTSTKENGSDIAIPTNTSVKPEVEGLVNTTAKGKEEIRSEKVVDNDNAVFANSSKDSGSKMVGTISIANAKKEQRVIANTEDKVDTEKDLSVASQNKKGSQDGDTKIESTVAKSDNPKGEKDLNPVTAITDSDAVTAIDDENKQPEKKSIYDAIKEQEMEKDVAAAQNIPGKWSVGPSVAPVYYNASGNGSPIHSDFVSNTKSGNLNLSYGLTVGYDLGKKLKIRSGVHKVNYGYDTNDVVFSSSLRASTSDKFANIDYSQNSETIVVQSKKSAANTILSSKEIAMGATPALDGKMVQQLGYIEVPLELNYALVERKFGLDLIGGVSSLFLVDNSVLLESNEHLITEMGEANNVNSLNFSANFGMGLNYRFATRFQINVEPIFKYQLNTFSNTSGNFRPYSIGVYSGIRYKF